LISVQEANMAVSDRAKLSVLLPHWIEHNTAHADDYRLWIQRAQAAGEGEVAAHLAAAVEKLEGISRDLAAALGCLGRPDQAADQAHPHEPHGHHHHGDDCSS